MKVKKTKLYFIGETKHYSRKYIAKIQRGHF